MNHKITNIDFCFRGLLFGLHFAKMNQEHCNIDQIVQLLMSWKKKLIIQ